LLRKVGKSVIEILTFFDFQDKSLRHLEFSKVQIFDSQSKNRSSGGGDMAFNGF